GPVFRWKGNPFNEGPSATPTADSGLIYALGAQGELVCVEAATGQTKWRKNLPQDLNAEVDPVGGGLGTEEGDPKLGWGFAWSPLVDGEQLVLVPGGPAGTMAALDKKTGEVRWQSKELTDRATYSSPLVAEIDGQRQYLIMT